MPYALTEMGKIKKVQRSVMRLVVGLRGIDFEVRLRILHLFPMCRRQVDPSVVAWGRDFLPSSQYASVTGYALPVILLKPNSTGLPIVCRFQYGSHSLHLQ